MKCGRGWLLGAAAGAASVAAAACGGRGSPSVAVLFHDYPLGSNLPGSPVYRLAVDGRCLYIRPLAFGSWTTEAGQRLAVLWPRVSADWDDDTRTLAFEGLQFQDGDIVDFVGASRTTVTSEQLKEAKARPECDYSSAQVAVWTDLNPERRGISSPEELWLGRRTDSAKTAASMLAWRTGVSVEEAERRWRLQEASHGVRNALRRLAPERVVSLTLEFDPDVHIVATYRGPLETLPNVEGIVEWSEVPIEFRSVE